MGGGFMVAANSASFAAATPPLSTAVSFPAVCTETQLSYCFENNTAFGPVPSLAEVEAAIIELQRFMNGISNTRADLEGLHGQMHHDHLKMIQSSGFIKFSEAFAMMRAEPPLQKLVVSISCDEAVWKAMLSNKAVNDLQGSISAAKEEKRLSYPNDEEEVAVVILRWMLGFAKSKIFQLLENFASVVNEIFQPTPKEKPASELNNSLDEKVRSSLLLSVVILIIVVFARGNES